MKLAGKRVWVTGASRGIGRAIAQALAGEGASVALTARSVSDLTSVKNIIEGAGGTALVVPADLADPNAIRRAHATIDKAWKGVDILVNNAGIGVFAPVRELALEDVDRMWALNVRSVFLCTQLCITGMEERRHGTIVNISSLAGKNSFVNGAGYAATKWALQGFTNCLRLEVRKADVRVITVCPGSVATDFSPGDKDPARAARILHAEDVAAAVLTAVTLPATAMMSEIDLRPTNP